MAANRHDRSSLRCAVAAALVLVIVLLDGRSHAATLTKADTSTMNTGADWGGTAPTSADDGTFTNLVSTTNLANMTLGGDVSLRSLIFNDINGPVTIAAGSTLTLGGVTNSIRMDNAGLNHDVTINAALAGIGSMLVKSGRTLSLGGGGTGSTVTFQGAGAIEVTAGALTGGLAVSNGDWSSPNTSGLVVMGSGTLSGNTNIGSNATGILRVDGATAQLSAPDGNKDVIVGRSNGRGLLQLDQGTVSASRNVYVGYQLTTSTANTGIFRMNGGTLAITGGSGNGRLDILSFTTGTAGEGAFELAGGTATMRWVTLGNGSSIGNARMDVTGGTLFIAGNSGTGIAWLGTGSATYSITLSGGTIAATGDWSSSADMKLGTTNGRITFKAADAGDVARNITLSGVLSDNGAEQGGLLKTGGGTLTLSAANTFSGGTRVDAGVLSLGNVNALQNSPLDVGGAGTVSFDVAGTNTYLLGGLAGTGTISPGTNLLSVASLAPGTSPGTITVAGSLAVTGTSTFEIDGWTSGLYDLVQGTAAGGEAMTFGGTLDIVFDPGVGAGSATIFDFDSYSGSFTSFTYSGLTGGKTATFDPATGVVAVIVPEPGSLGAALGGLVALALAGRGRRRAL